jgi:hypothetical protein
MRDSGKVNKHCQLPSLASFPVFNSRGLLLIVFVNSVTGNSHYWGVDYGKRCETREKLISLINSRDVSHQVPESSNYSQYCPQRVFSVRIWVSRIFPRIWSLSHLFPSINSRDNDVSRENCVVSFEAKKITHKTKQHNFLGKHHCLGRWLTGKDEGVTKFWGKYARLKFSQRKLAADNTGSNWNSRVLDARHLGNC